MVEDPTSHWPEVFPNPSCIALPDRTLVLVVGAFQVRFGLDLSITQVAVAAAAATARVRDLKNWDETSLRF